MRLILLCIAFGFVYESISWFFRIHISSAWLAKERSRQPSIEHEGRVYILLPVLAETEILEDTVQYFNKIFLSASSSIFLIIITTEKEKLLTTKTVTTIELAQELALTYPNVRHIHYPKPHGKMAHQLNYAVTVLMNEDKINEEDLIAVYNADSRPEPQTFAWIQSKIKEKQYSVFQQYGCYSGNLLQIQASPEKTALTSAALWQTRWAIGFEIYYALRQLKFLSKRSKESLNYPYNYCIGHGLCMTKRIFDKVGGFCETMHNEDAILGLQLSDIGETIMPVPYFDISESPDSLLVLYTQKANWYFGPLQAYSYLQYLLATVKYNRSRKFRLFLLSSKLFCHAIFWIMGPTLMIILLISIGLVHSIEYAFFGLCAIGLFALPSIVSYQKITAFKVISLPLDTFKTSMLQLRGFFIFYILHGLSAYRGLYKYGMQIISKKEAVKEKTVLKRMK